MSGQDQDQPKSLLTSLELIFDDKILRRCLPTAYLDAEELLSESLQCKTSASLILSRYNNPHSGGKKIKQIQVNPKATLYQLTKGKRKGKAALASTGAHEGTLLESRAGIPPTPHYHSYSPPLLFSFSR
jgi:hypothetical protein